MRHLVNLTAAVVVSLTFASLASASIETDDVVKWINNNMGGTDPGRGNTGISGGWFVFENQGVATGGGAIDSSGGRVGNRYTTFCVETAENITTSQNYKVTLASTNSQSGSPTISTFSAFLYTAWDAYFNGDTTTFITNMFGGLGGTNGQRLNESIQIALWREFGALTNADVTTILGGGSKFGVTKAKYQNYLADKEHDTSSGAATIKNVTSWDAALALNDPDNAVGITIADVAVMQLTTYPGGVGSQDQIVMGMAPAPPEIPEPISVAVWGLFGGLGLVAARRRRRN